MATFISLTPTISVAGQIDATDIEHAAAMGYKTIICNRPDSEEGVTFSSTQAAVRARELGMAFHYVPVIGFEVTDEDNISTVADVLRNAEEPVLLYCKSGTRCTLLWAQIYVGELGVDAVEATASAAGYDISVIEDELTELAEASLPPQSAAETGAHIAA